MAAGGNKEVSTPFIVGAVVIVLIVIGVIAWKMFSPPPDPMGGMSLQQKVEALKQAQKNLHPRNGHAGFLH
jgi:hypothetical protein